MSASGWLERRERGALLLIWLTMRLATVCGRRAMRPLVFAIAGWYRLFDREAVASSRAWLRRVDPSGARSLSVYRHLATFAEVTLDRVFLLTRRTRGIEFTRTGDHLLREQAATGRGAVLLGAHLGSYAAMSAGGMDDGVPIKIVGYFENARRINGLLRRLDPEHDASVIHLGTDVVGTALRLQASVERGELIAILGDRVGLNERVVRARFLGEEAEFPAGPFLLASILRCPVYLVFGLYRRPDRYDLHCEPFAERLELPRAQREQHLAEVVQRYAARVEEHALREPYNWFNFFDFWRRA